MTKKAAPDKAGSKEAPGAGGKGKRASKAIAKPRVQTEKEKATVAKLRERYDALPERARSKIVSKPDGGMNIENDGDKELYALDTFTAMGSKSVDFTNRTASQLGKVVGGRNELTSQDYNATMAVMAALEPANEAEAMLSVSMIAAHEGAMRCMRGMIASDYLEQTKMWGDLANKFMRTHAAQMEALAKIRRGSEQVVKYIHVHEGGQAVVAGTINQGGRQIEKGDEQPCGPASDASLAALPCPDPSRNGVPIPSDAKGRCRIHGGKSTGAPKGNKNALKHGMRSAEFVKLRALARALRAAVQ